jgi:hypothetical protein
VRASAFVAAGQTSVAPDAMDAPDVAGATDAPGHAHARTEVSPVAAVAPVAPPSSPRLPLRRSMQIGTALSPAWIPGAAALLGTHPDVGISVEPQLAFAGALLVAGLTSHISVTGDGTLTTWTFGLRRRVRLGELVEMGGRRAPNPGDRVALHGATLLLRDARGGTAGITANLWRDDASLLELIGAYVVAGKVPVADPAAQLLGLDASGDVPPDLRVPRSVLLGLGVLLVAVALMIV